MTPTEKLQENLDYALLLEQGRQRELHEMLEKKFQESVYSMFKVAPRRTAFVWTSVRGYQCTYGSFKHVQEDELKNRLYVLERHDASVSIRYTDICHWVPGWSSGPPKYP